MQDSDASVSGKRGEAEADLHAVAVALFLSHLLRDREQGTLPFGVPPHACLPGDSIDCRNNWGASPTVGDRGRVFLGDVREGPAARPWDLKERAPKLNHRVQTIKSGDIASIVPRT
jgi:hypothetical protein